MPKTLADGRTRLVALLTEPAIPGAPTVAELTAGTDLSCSVLKSDYRLSPVASDTVADTELCAEGNAVVYGASNYEGTITPFRYLDPDGQPDATDDEPYDTLRTKGTYLWLVEREGPKYDVPFAAGDEVEVYEVVTDNPQKPSDRAGYIKRTIPLGVQRAWLDAVVAGP